MFSVVDYDCFYDRYFSTQIWPQSLLEAFHTQHRHFIPGVFIATNFICVVEGFPLLPRAPSPAIWPPR